MIRRLRVKFICINMTLVTLMLCVIFGLVLHFTRQTMQIQSITTMQRIASNSFQLGSLGERPEDVRLPFFTVQLGRGGELINTSGGYFDLSDRDFILELVRAAQSGGEDTGVLKDYNLRYCRVMNSVGERIVFADTSTEQATLRSLFYSCLFIGALSLLAFFFISILLSSWAVRPVARAWDQQRQFVADASHELKTPLAVILANAELLQEEGYSPVQRRGFARSILSTTYQMRSLVDNLLELARVDADGRALTLSPLDFSQLVGNAVLSFLLLYEERGLPLNSRLEGDVRLRGSEAHLYQVMDVLLDNALKYSDPAGPVTVTLERQGASCLLCVASPGPSISKEDQQNIFKRFYRIDKARTDSGSYGLGLPIAQSIVAAHKGRIWAQSREGINSFFVQLPADPI